MIYIFIQDEDGHYYKIPKELKDEFNKLLYDIDKSGMECWERDEWKKFDDMRCEHYEIEEFIISIQEELEILKKQKSPY